MPGTLYCRSLVAHVVRVSVGIQVGATAVVKNRREHSGIVVVRVRDVCAIGQRDVGDQ